jgi:hypothetical protein
VIALDEQIHVFTELYNWFRPHEAIGLVAPIIRYLAEPPPRSPEPHLSEPQGVQKT